MGLDGDIFVTGNPVMANTELGIVMTTEILRLTPELEKFENFYFFMDEDIFLAQAAAVHKEYTLVPSLDGDRILICK